MNRKSPGLLALEILLPTHQVTLRLLEPPGSCRNTLWERLCAGTYQKPFIWDIGRTRCLHFDFDAAQSAMYLDDPHRLSLAYTRMMMAFLLFNRSPRRVLLLGLGGGSLAKFCYRHLPLAAITAVEVNRDVIALREAFRIPADDERFRVVLAESAHYVAGVGPGKDVILADACDRHGVAPQLEPTEFYHSTWRRLSPRGVFVMNACADPSREAAHLAKIRQVFGEVVTLRVRGGGNLIVFAFKDGLLSIGWEQLEAGALELRRRFKLDFPRYLRRMASDWESRTGPPPARPARNHLRPDLENSRP